MLITKGFAHGMVIAIIFHLYFLYHFTILIFTQSSSRRMQMTDTDVGGDRLLNYNYGPILSMLYTLAISYCIVYGLH
jgi:hypothetical protein